MKTSFFFSAELAHVVPENKQGILWDCLNQLKNSDIQQVKLEYCRTSNITAISLLIHELGNIDLSEIISLIDGLLLKSFIEAKIPFPKGSRFFIEEVLQFKKVQN